MDVLISTANLAANSFVFYFLMLIYPIRFPSARNLVDCPPKLLQSSIDFFWRVPDVHVLKSGELMRQTSRPVDRIHSLEVMLKLEEEPSRQDDINPPSAADLEWEMDVGGLLDLQKCFSLICSKNLLVAAAAEGDDESLGVVQKERFEVEVGGVRRFQTALGIEEVAAFAKPDLEGI